MLGRKLGALQTNAMLKKFNKVKTKADRALVKAKEEKQKKLEEEGAAGAVLSKKTHRTLAASSMTKTSVRTDLWSEAVTKLAVLSP